MKKKTLFLSLVLLVLFGIAIYFYFFKTAEKPIVWRTVPIEKGDVNVLVTATGAMAADTSVDVGVQVSGIVAKIKVDFNAIVKKGQVIAVLDTTLYYAAKLDATAALQRAQVAVDQAKREFDRSKNLFDSTVLAQADYDLAITAYQTAQTNFI